MKATCETCRGWREEFHFGGYGRRLGWCLNPLNDEIGGDNVRKVSERYSSDSCGEHWPREEKCRERQPRSKDDE